MSLKEFHYGTSANYKISTTQTITATVMAITLMARSIAAVPLSNSIGSKWDEKMYEIVLSYMNKSVDPCKDFFSYTCGRWSEYHLQSRYSESTGYVDHMINKKFVNFLNGPTPRNYTNSFFDKVLMYYKSCRAIKNTDLLKYLTYVKPAVNVDWPAFYPNITNWPHKKFNWLLTLAKLRRYGLHNCIIDHTLEVDSDNSYRFLIEFDRPSFKDDMKLPRLLEIMVFLNKVNVPKDILRYLALQIKKFEKELSKLTEYDEGYVQVSIKRLEMAFPNVPWKRYLETVVGHPLQSNFIIRLRNVEYFQRLVSFMEKSNPYIVCNYIMMKFLYFLTIDGTRSNDKINCVIDVRSKMDVALNFVYEDMLVQNLDKNKVSIERIFEALRTEFRTKLDENLLQLDQNTRDNIKDKLNDMTLNVGQFTYKLNFSEVNYYYHGLNIDPKDYRLNHLNLLKLRSHKDHLQLFYSKQDIIRSPLIMDTDNPPSCTPYYLVTRNIIVVPPGILKFPMFRREHHDVFKMSLMGFLLGHELSHGFDSTGIRYNNESSNSVWGNEIADNNTHFIENFSCMMNQLETSNIDERIADFLGLRLAYDAYFGPNSTFDTRQPDFSEIPIKQLFFLNFAQFFCGDLGATFDDHDDDNVRVHQTLMNFRPFAEAFNCKQGDRYYVEDVCRIW